ncbi:OLC1v1012398C1 [Oldenlandia corymbosa var. corymbosa]|uniref:OLC1v1012398C1 n=1 Tax=Oldenlandia corymbosa var. corymbosa TaxID=529605 RepID=A0AAV1DYV5_OLDCO|nr:OLC1v1012398C1 [Oldenlandia corymbosa var. corymbosa]
MYAAQKTKQDVVNQNTISQKTQPMSAAHKTNTPVYESAMIGTHDPVYTDHELETYATDVAAFVEGSVTSVEKKNVRSVELALIDAQGSKIQATIPGRMMKDFMKYFKDEGVCRRLSRFDHGLNISGGYRCSKHEYKIVFGSDTLVESAVDLEIPNHVFEYTPFAEITNFVANFDYCFAKVSATTNLYNGRIYLNDMTIPDIYEMEQDEIKGASINKISLLSSISGYTSFEDFVHDAEMLTLSGISELDQGTDDYPEILEEIVGKKCLFRLDVSNYNIRNITSEISVARVTTDAEIIKKYLDVVSDDQEIDPDLSSEFYPNVTPTQYSTAKTAISCTDETELGLPGDESVDSPPPKKSTSAHYGEESVKSCPSKRARKL